ncbi:MAG TPA: DUF2357 domain-containing protein [Bacilli bacterium]
MAKKDDLDNFYSSVMGALNSTVQKEKFTEYFYRCFLAGDTVVYQKNIAEFKNFDNEWIKTVEMYLPSLEKIIKNPKSTLRYEEEIVPIEKVKKVSKDSIKHLSQHTENIKTVDENGNVIPSKLLTTHAEVDYAIYENRFIMTLINRLSVFVGNRYEVIRCNIDSKQRNHLNFKSGFNINQTEVAFDLDLVIKSDIEDNLLKERNEALLERVTKLVHAVSGLKNSPFMMELKDAKPVLPPIMKTNIILKNPDFRNAYSLWLFLDSYNALIYDIDVQEKDLDIDSNYLMDLNQLALLAYSFILYNQKTRRDVYAEADTVQYVRKATKIVRIHPQDVVENPDAIQMEDNTINEYYLDQNQKIFKKSLVDLLSNENVSYEEALRKAMFQTMDITNSLYKSVFESKPELFDELENLKPRDLEKDYEEIKQKASLAKIIRETKEVDFRKSIELEKQQLEELGKVQEELIKSKSFKRRLVKEKKGVGSSDKNAELRAAQAKKLADKKIIIQTIQELSTMRKELFETQKEINDRLLKQTEKELIAAERERAKIERQEELERLRQERKEKLAQQRAYYEEQKRLIRDKYRQLSAMILENEQANRAAQIQKLQEEYQKIREERISQLKKQFAV